MAYENPSVASFKEFFTRDFPYGSDPDTSVLDSDITKAFTMTNINLNESLFSDQGTYNVAYLLLSAHYLVTNLQASSQGINGQFNFSEQGKSVGGVSQQFAIPQRLLDNPYFSFLMKTNYGAQYLQLVMPLLTGKMFIAPGSTRP
jgi:hypothetical protein